MNCSIYDKIISILDAKNIWINFIKQLVFL